MIEKNEKKGEWETRMYNSYIEMSTHSAIFM